MIIKVIEIVIDNNKKCYNKDVIKYNKKNDNDSKKVKIQCNGNKKNTKFKKNIIMNVNKDFVLDKDIINKNSSFLGLLKYDNKINYFTENFNFNHQYGIV